MWVLRVFQIQLEAAKRDRLPNSWFPRHTDRVLGASACNVLRGSEQRQSESSNGMFCNVFLL